MELESIYMTKSNYGVHKGQVSGTIKFSGGYGSIELTLTHENAQEILRICSGRLVEQSREAANSMTAAIFENLAEQIEDKSGEALQ